jgi:hypothetical protein
MGVCVTGLANEVDHVQACFIRAGELTDAGMLADKGVNKPGMPLVCPLSNDDDERVCSPQIYQRKSAKARDRSNTEIRTVKGDLALCGRVHESLSAARSKALAVRLFLEVVKVVLLRDTFSISYIIIALGSIDDTVNRHLVEG